MISPRTAQGFVSRVVEAFLHGNLSVLIILVMLACGVAALLLTPRREPQIVVPVADIFVRMPTPARRKSSSKSPRELERLLAQIDGVEYVYSMSRPGEAIVTVRFFVGENREASLVKLHNKNHDEHRRECRRGHGVGGQASRDRRRSAGERDSVEQDRGRLRALPARGWSRSRSRSRSAGDGVDRGGRRRRRQLRVMLDPEA